MSHEDSAFLAFLDMSIGTDPCVTYLTKSSQTSIHLGSHRGMNPHVSMLNYLQDPYRIAVHIPTSDTWTRAQCRHTYVVQHVG